MTDLLITYPAGSTTESSIVVATARAGTEMLFAVERTPCHPESPRWPDQPADRCTLALSQSSSSAPPVPVECLEGYLHGGELGLRDPPEDAHGAIRCVVHRITGNTTVHTGEQVRLSVDEHHRELLSRSHTRCHLVSLALNAALAGSWRKDPPARDSLGNPDFDKLAIVSSEIGVRGSLDVYRVGKHLRKAGFSADTALSDTDALAAAVAQIVDRWLQSSLTSTVTPGHCRLETRRTWSCELPEGTASFPCGGTHIKCIEPDEGLAVAIFWDPQERRLAMRASSGTQEVQSVYD